MILMWLGDSSAQTTWYPFVAIPETVFSVTFSEFQGTPWSEDDYTSIWTVRGLRKDGSAEVFIRS